MNFLERIKEDLRDLRNNAGREKVAVNTQALIMLIDHFERLDSAARVEYNNRPMVPMEQRLSEAIQAVYLEQGKDAETTLFVIMGTLLPLMEEKMKQKRAPVYRG